VNSCTAALHLALRAADISGYEVITTPMTFVSTNHAILYNGASPVFADIEPDTLNIDAADVARKITPRTKAIVVVHYGGHACDLDAICDIAEARGLLLIEDCAHACGGRYRGRQLGGIGDYGCFSFHAVKNLATGDGGMVTTRHAEAAARIRKLEWLGISKGTWNRSDGAGYSWEYDVEELGFKYHMNDITASLGLVQLAKLDRMNGRRRALALRYTKALKSVGSIETPVEKPYARSAWHNYVIKVANPQDRDPLMEHLKAKGVATGMHYIPNHLYDMYRPYATEPLPVAEEVWKRLVTLPLYPDLTESEQDSVVAAIKEYFFVIKRTSRNDQGVVSIAV
jgi:perosamine synthetase